MRARQGEAEKGQIPNAYFEGSSMRGICRIFKVSRPTLAKWLKKARLNPEMVDTLLAAESHDVLEADEEWSFVKRRPDKRWSWIAPCRRTRQGVAYVIGDRSEKSRRTLWDAIPECYQHVHGHSDFWVAYQKVFLSYCQIWCTGNQAAFCF